MAGGSTRAWRRTRALVLARDGYRCQVKHADICKVRADCVHHVDGREVSGDNPDRCVAACTPCNLREGDVRSKDPEPNVRAWW
jgi:5-methylcytosine-specific restriction endonuclease McrA